MVYLIEDSNFRCAECGKTFWVPSACSVHHLDERHEEFVIIGSDQKMIIKSDDKAREWVETYRKTQHPFVMWLDRMI